MFDFTPMGAILSAVGIVFLTFFWWLVPQRERQGASIHEAIEIDNYVAEARITANSTVLGKTVGDLLELAHGEALVTSILRQKSPPRLTPLPDVTLREGDILMIEGSHEALDRLAAQAKFSLTDDREAGDGPSGEVEAIEAVIAENSPLIGWSAQRLALYDRFKVNLLAVSRQGERQTERLGQITLKLGDVTVLQGNRAALPETLREIGRLPLAERPILLGSARAG
jgi:di/tricarboxylate transporter